MGKKCVFVNLANEKCQQINDEDYGKFCKNHHEITKYYCLPFTSAINQYMKCTAPVKNKTGNCTGSFVLVSADPFGAWVNYCEKCYNDGPKNEPSIETIKIFGESRRHATSEESSFDDFDTEDKSVKSVVKRRKTKIGTD